MTKPVCSSCIAFWVLWNVCLLLRGLQAPLLFDLDLDDEHETVSANDEIRDSYPAASRGVHFGGIDIGKIDLLLHVFRKCSLKGLPDRFIPLKEVPEYYRHGVFVEAVEDISVVLIGY